MGKLIMWNLQTLDGYFDGATPWDLAWHSAVWGPELEQISIQQLHSAAGLVFGRKTYQGMADYWTTATDEAGEVADLMNAIPKVVFSRTLTGADWHNSRLMHEATSNEVARLKSESSKDLFIFGSANLSDTLTKNGLIDEYRICMVPVVLGGGIPLFKPSAERLPLHLLESRPLASGGVILRYESDRGAPAVV